MTEPDPTRWFTYGEEILPKLLTQACGVEAGLADGIAGDVMQRAEAFATLSDRAQDVLIAPFVEEVFDHRPLGAALDLKAKVTLIVRNSALEQAHHDGPLGSGIVAITEYAAAPLSHFLAARRRKPIDYSGPNPFAGLPERYPRAWACLDALTDAFAEGGRRPLRLAAAPIPELPSGEEVVTLPAATEDDGAETIFSAIDPRFDDRLVAMLSQAMHEDRVLVTSALSRYSRNSEKLHRILEYLLAHNATVLTTNYLIRSSDVWVRRGNLVKPDSQRPYDGLTQTRGLAGTHRKLAETLARQLGQ
ncbi:hypothetical protein Aca07nite_64640 [Actinoplanes capillaceus]|uniref:Uncharacterized protein n=1 Tax=Actinoplanes campanulatus TaxID=113559 RepID=A0ABQ3WSD3_9ACTN|nr:hypothetical protein [Actinoplanes capillaceus]GID49189.1 hypothetical protein Aca07nite_64640 [Actinoplanes capillaceus]